MDSFVTKAIVLRRTNYGEADRIMTFLTPKHGKVRVIAKGVRKVKSKLAGGIELFSESSLTLVKGRSELNTLVSSRLETHYGGIVKNLDRTQKGYDFITLIDAVTEDNCDESYYRLLSAGLQYLNVEDLSTTITSAWFYARLLLLSGHTPELYIDVNSEKLQEGQAYLFDFSAGRFQPADKHGVSTDAIKLLRLMQTRSPAAIRTIKKLDDILPQTAELLEKFANYYLNPR